MNITKPEIHPKAWGSEHWLINNDKFCGKILHLNKGAKFSNHYHLLKSESQHLFSGQLWFTFIDTRTAEKLTKIIEPGMTIHIPAGQPHQLEAMEDSVIFEVSTTHFESDSYRIEPGDSQNKINSLVVPDDMQMFFESDKDYKTRLGKE